MAFIEYCNGIGVSHVKIPRLGDNPGTPWVDSDLPLAMIEGHEENWIDNIINEECQNLDTITPNIYYLQKIFGYVPQWSLDYTGLPLKPSDIIIIKNLYNYRKYGPIQFTPRIDYVGRDRIYDTQIISPFPKITTVPGKNPRCRLSGQIIFRAINMVTEINLATIPDPTLPDTVVAGGSGTAIEGQIL